jgi:hypothetical protein
MRFVIVAIASLALASVASGTGGTNTAPTTTISIVALNGSVGRAVFHFRCGPIGGDMPDPAQACTVLDQEPELITSPQPFVCRGGPQSHWTVRISGSLNGQAVRQEFDTCWTTQMPTIARFGLTWNVLQAHLVPRRHGTVRAGTTRRFGPGVLREVDLVRCTIFGMRLEVAVPIETWGRASLISGRGRP